MGRAVSLLASAGLAPYDYDGALEKFCRDVGENGFNNRLREWANSVNKTIGCTSVGKAGESVDIAGNTGSGLTDTGYRLTRKPNVPGNDGKPVPGFSIAVNLQFTDGTGNTDAALQKKYGDDSPQIRAEIRRWRMENPTPPGSVHTVLDHIDHIARTAGVDHVGLGSDFDGIERVPEQLEDVSTYPHITQGLLDRGYSAPDIKKILGGNLLRVLGEAEKTARRLQHKDANG